MDLESAVQFIEKKIDEFPTEVKDLYSKILDDIEKLQNDKPIETPNDSFKNTIRKLVRDLYDGGVEDDRLRFFEAFSFLIYNWNNNTIKDSDIETYSIIIKKFITSIVLLKRSKNTMKNSIETFNRYRGWLPPINDISLSYLDELFKKNEMENDKTDLEQNNENSCCGC